MTFVLGAVSPKSAWLVADRRLSSRGRAVSDSANKIMVLETTDGLALLAYAGIGRTVGRTEPSEWMARVLRGINAPLEQSLSILRDAVVKRLPKHLAGTPLEFPSHTIIAVGFKDKTPRVYTIDLMVQRNPARLHHRFTRHITPAIAKLGPRAERGVLLVAGGSGAQALLAAPGFEAKTKLVRRLVRAVDSGQISASAVAAQLAKLNLGVSATTADQSVGHKSIVVWRLLAGGGGHDYFDGMRSEAFQGFATLPIISHGMDMGAMFEAISRPMMEAFERSGPEQLLDLTAAFADAAVINARLAELPETPDDTLN